MLGSQRANNGYNFINIQIHVLKVEYSAHIILKGITCMHIVGNDNNNVEYSLDWR